MEVGGWEFLEHLVWRCCTLPVTQGKMIHYTHLAVLHLWLPGPDWGINPKMPTNHIQLICQRRVVLHRIDRKQLGSTDFAVEKTSYLTTSNAIPHYQRSYDCDKVSDVVREMII